MITPVEQRSLELRQEHTRISSELETKRSVFKNRLQSPSKARKAAAFVASHYSKDPFNTTMETLIGPKLIRETGQLEAAYDQNITDAAEHVAAHYDEYIALAEEHMPQPAGQGGSAAPTAK